jgi:hypothetical protein
VLTDTASSKVTAAHLTRSALLYVRQSTLKQVINNTESRAERRVPPELHDPQVRGVHRCHGTQVVCL